MTTIRQSTRRYETWLRKRLKGAFVEDDLVEKHEKMRESPFVFLRATYWRWAETILDVCPALADATAVLSVGDIHFENYGTWRDADGRLVWGINDFDEAAEMPYALDLVRLTTSALLGRGTQRISDDDVAAAILRGYRRGLRAPSPVILDRDWQWLRDLLVVSDKQRAKFWKKIAAAKSLPAPRAYRAAIEGAMPERGLTIKTSRRTAGTGSLGRPRWVGAAEWRGAPVVREAKALVCSAWSLARGEEDAASRVAEIAGGRFRSVDPWYRATAGILVRRLSPNNRKIEVRSTSSMFSREMLEAMGLDLANAHLGTSDQRTAIKRDLKKRKSGWLVANARQAADATSRDFKAWKAG
jgi:uncharacterized protein (DUF2252 family)